MVLVRERAGPRSRKPILALVRRDIRALPGYLEFQHQGGVRFRSAVAAGLNSFPTEVHAPIHRAKGKVVTCDRVVNYAPELAGQTIRGQRNVTFEGASGVYLGKRRAAVVAEIRVRDGRPEPVPDVEETVREEIGHALDHALGDVSRNDKAFVQAYRVERRISKRRAAFAGNRDPHAALVGYLFQSGKAGAQEAFAALVAIIHGGWLTRDVDRIVVERLARTKLAVEAILQSLTRGGSAP